MNDGRDSNDLDRAHDHNPPAFNLPRIVTISCAVLIAAHALRLLLDQDANAEIFLQFAFIPERYASMSEVHAWPGGLGAAVWSFVTYSFLHGDWMHLTLNVVWFAAFGAAVARRLKGLWFFILCALCSVAGAVTHLLVYGPDSGIVIGASAAVSGLMGSAARFIFAGTGFSLRGDETALLPLSPLTDRRVMAFTAVWFAVNLIFGLLGFGIDGNVRLIALEAHIGGYLAGLVLLPTLERFGRLSSRS